MKTLQTDEDDYNEDEKATNEILSDIDTTSNKEEEIIKQSVRKYVAKKPEIKEILKVKKARAAKANRADEKIGKI